MRSVRARWFGGFALLVVTCLLGASGAAAVQPATTLPPATTATTQPVTTTTAPSTTTTPATTTPVTSTTPAAPPTQAPTATTSDSGDDFPWLAVVLAVAVLAAIIFGTAALSRRRAQRHSAVDAWRRRAADETAEIGATARLLAGGTPVSAAIAQQVLASLRVLDDLAQSAPDDDARQATHQARQAVRAMGVAIDADVSARRAQPPVAQEQLDAADAGLRAAADDADRVLRTSYHEFSGAS
jgi:cytoskeletal protein RodZ